MGSLAKAYCHHSIPFRRYRPLNPQNSISLFSITSPSPSSPLPSDSYLHNKQKQQQQPQIGQFIIPTIAVAASALFFIRLHQNPPIIISPVDLQQLEFEEEDVIKEVPLSSFKAIHLYKIKQGTILKLIDVYSSVNNESLKARIRISAEWLETARRELEEVVDKDPGRVMKYYHVVDELMEILRDMEGYIDNCEKEEVRVCLRTCNRLLARVRKIEAQILNVLKEFQEDDEHGGGGQT